MCQSLCFIRLQAEVCNFIKKDGLAQVFSCEFSEIFKNTFLKEHIWATASEVLMNFECSCPEKASS